MSTITLELDDKLASVLADAAARQQKPLALWAAEQLAALAPQSSALRTAGQGVRPTGVAEVVKNPSVVRAQEPDWQQAPPLPSGQTRRVLGLHVGPGYRMSDDFNQPDEDFASVN